MKKRLARVSPLQLGIVLAVLYGLLALIIIVPMGLIFAAVGVGGSHAMQNSGPSPAMVGSVIGGVMMILMPILYAVMGFICGVIVGAVYNLVASWTGGIEFTVVDVLEQ